MSESNSPDRTEAALSIVLDQMNEAMAVGLYMPALMVALTVPDMCAALGSSDGVATGAKYMQWISDYLDPEDAEPIWRYRCSLLHQGSGIPDRGSGPRIFFMVPGTSGTVIGRGHYQHGDGPDAMFAMSLSVPLFVKQITEAAIKWVRAVGASANVVANLEQHAHYRPNGLPPFFGGTSVVG